MTDLSLAMDAAREIAETALGRVPGAMAAAPSDSHHVYVGPDIVIKVIEAHRHRRLDREIILAPCLPAGLTAPLLASGLHRVGANEFRYACYSRVPGAAPGIGMPGVDSATARLLAEEAVLLLGKLHSWTPSGRVEQTLREPLDDGGFVSQAALVADIAALDAGGTIPRRLIDGLTAIASHAPTHAQAFVPVHADCHWGNWLVSRQNVTALLDFEWARFGEQADDWFFLARFSGPHLETVLDVIVRATGTPAETLRAECEVRDAAHLASELRASLERPNFPAEVANDRFRSLEELVTGRCWWRQAR